MSRVFFTSLPEQCQKIPTPSESAWMGCPLQKTTLAKDWPAAEHAASAYVRSFRRRD